MTGSRIPPLWRRLFRNGSSPFCWMISTTRCGPLWTRELRARPGRLPRPAAKADHAGVSADSSPTVGGNAFEIRLLGPSRAVRLGQEVGLGGPKQRAVLALLLLEAGRVVPTTRLVEEVWRGQPPPGAAKT